MQGSLIKWKPGNLIGFGRSGQVMQALNLENGTLFAVKRILNFNIHLEESIENFKNIEVNVIKQTYRPK